jgi:hypothetical protein
LAPRESGPRVESHVPGPYGDDAQRAPAFGVSAARHRDRIKCRRMTNPALASVAIDAGTVDGVLMLGMLLVAIAAVDKTE